MIKEYFLNYNEALSNDFVLEGTAREAGSSCSAVTSRDWRVTFVDTGMKRRSANGSRRSSRTSATTRYFLATYGDGLTDAPLDDMIERTSRVGKTALFLSVQAAVQRARRRRRRGRTYARRRT